MKKILLLGGSSQQIIAIETAKRLGYYTVLCDYLEDNPGQYCADKFYLVSTTDKEKVLQIAKREKIDGILAYASDPAAPTAAYVAEILDLPTNPYESVNTLCNKNKFREFLAEKKFNTPASCSYDSEEKAIKALEFMKFPVIIKPVDSSGSKGVTVLESCNDDKNNAVKLAFSFSRSHKIIIEKFIEKKHPYLVGGDIFINNGEVILWGLLNCHRDSSVNPLVPVGKSFPLELSDKDIYRVKMCLQHLVNELSISQGAMNVELIVDKNDEVWLIDVGPRNGGNMIPDLLGMIYNVDIVEMSVKSAMGVLENIEDKKEEKTKYYATHNLHSKYNGIFENIEFSEELSAYIIKKIIYKKPGEKIEYFDNAAKALGIIFLKFNSKEEMNDILGKINDHIEIYIQK